MPAVKLVDFVTKTEKSLLDAQINKDKKALEEIISDEYIGVNPDGSKVTKHEEIENLLSTSYSSVEILEMDVNTYGETAVATGKIVLSGEGLAHKYSFTDVFVNNKLVSCQATLLG